MALDLPQSVLDLVEYKPLEEAALYALRQGMPDVPIYTLIPEQSPDFFVLVRRDYAFGEWGGHPRFVDEGRIIIHTFTSDPDGDEKGALLSEAVRVVLRNAWEQNLHVPGHGWIIHAAMRGEPTRKTDWATASGPVQYADLPNGVWRYETKYDLRVRRELTR